MSHFHLNLHQTVAGIFTINHTSASEYSVYQRIYAHRTRSTLLVNEVWIERTGAEGEISLKLYNNRGNDTADMELETRPSALGSWYE